MAIASSASAPRSRQKWRLAMPRWYARGASLCVLFFRPGQLAPLLIFFWGGVLHPEKKTPSKWVGAPKSWGDLPFLTAVWGSRFPMDPTMGPGESAPIEAKRLDVTSRDFSCRYRLSVVRSN